MLYRAAGLAHCTTRSADRIAQVPSCWLGWYPAGICLPAGYCMEQDWHAGLPCGQPFCRSAQEPRKGVERASEPAGLPVRLLLPPFSRTRSPCRRALPVATLPSLSYQKPCYPSLIRSLRLEPRAIREASRIAAVGTKQVFLSGNPPKDRHPGWVGRTEPRALPAGHCPGT